MPAAKDGPVVAAVKRDLKQMPALADSALAAGALVMAAILDSPDGSFTSKSMCFGKLHEAMDRLRELAPPVEKKDGLDDIVADRALRLAASGGERI